MPIQCGWITQVMALRTDLHGVMSDAVRNNISLWRMIGFQMRLFTADPIQINLKASTRLNNTTSKGSHCPNIFHALKSLYFAQSTWKWEDNKKQTSSKGFMYIKL